MASKSLLPVSFKAKKNSEIHQTLCHALLKVHEPFESPIFQLDQPFAALASSSVIPADGEGGRKDACGISAQSFDSSALALRAVSANSVMARAFMSWIEAYQKTSGKMLCDLHNLLKKDSLAIGLTADSSLDTLQFTTKSMASNVVARRNVWLGCGPGVPKPGVGFLICKQEVVWANP